MSEIQGVCPEAFAAVREAFTANFDEDKELGAGFCVTLDGEVIVDLWAGFADRKRTRPWTPDTLAPVFSTSKGVSGLVIARAAAEGELDYAAQVVDLWPEFGQHGKDGLTVEQVLSHQAGLPGFVEPIEPTLWFDWDGLCAELAKTAPMWPPGTASGYHPVTWGYLAGEIFRRATGRTLGQDLRTRFAEPFGLDLWLGLPDAEHGRASEMMKPTAPGLMGEINHYKRAAFLTPWASPAGRGSADWRRMEIPSANVHATAPALARLYAAAACDGRLDGRLALPPGAVAEAARERIGGQDLVLPFPVSWGAGFFRNTSEQPYGPSPNAFGHSGWGGSCAFADPDRRMSVAYVMNRQSVHLIADPRALRLIEAVYASV